MPSLVEIVPVVLEKKMKTMDNNKEKPWTRDKFWSEKLTWAFGSGELQSYPINMKITSTYFQMMSNIQINPRTHFLEHVWTKPIVIRWEQTEERTEWQTNGQGETNSFAGDIISPVFL